MVCDRCILSVREILERNKIAYKEIALGTIQFQDPPSALEKRTLQEEFINIGFQIVSKKNDKIVSQIKAIILKEIYEPNDIVRQNLSVSLSEKMHFDYSHLSAIFSKNEGKSIQKFQNEVKVERIKELLENDELSISEIASKLGFGSSAYLSTQFKSITGITPSQYKSNNQSNRNSLDIF